jgi:hypothetical protein
MLRFWVVIAIATVGCGSRTGLEIEPLAVDASVPDGIDASIAPFPCRWGLGVPLTLGESGGDLSVTVDETKLAVVGSGGIAWATRDGRVFGPFMSLAPLSSRTPSGFVFVDDDCSGSRIDFGSEGDVEVTPVPLVTGDRCWIGRGDRDAFPLFVARFGRVLVQRVPRNLEGFATIGEAPPSFARVARSASLVDEQMYYVEAGSLRWQDVGGALQAVALPGRVREIAVDAVNRGVVVLLEDRAAFVARGVVDREVELAPVFPHLAVSDQEALALGLDGTLWTLPLSRGPARAVERMPPPEDAIVALAEGHAVGGVASIEGPLVIWRPLTCNR